MPDRKIYFGGEISNRSSTLQPNINPNNITLKEYIALIILLNIPITFGCKV